MAGKALLALLRVRQATPADFQPSAGPAVAAGAEAGPSTPRGAQRRAVGVPGMPALGPSPVAAGGQRSRSHQVYDTGDDLEGYCAGEPIPLLHQL